MNKEGKKMQERVMKIHTAEITSGVNFVKSIAYHTVVYHLSC